MIDLILNFFHFDPVIITIGLFGFFIGLLGIIDGIYICHHTNLKKIDMVFQGSSVDYGIVFNMMRAGQYGLAMIFPNTIGKRLYKNVDYGSIEKRTKLLYIFYPSSLLLSVLFLVFTDFLIRTK